MRHALDQARKWSLDAVTKLAAADAATKSVVRRWFADDDTSDDDITKAMGTPWASAAGKTYWT